MDWSNHKAWFGRFAIVVQEFDLSHAQKDNSVCFPSQKKEDTCSMLTILQSQMKTYKGLQIRNANYKTVQQKIFYLYSASWALK